MRSTNAKAPTKTLWSDLTVCIAITLTLSLSSLPTTWALSDKRLCADEKCERIISTGNTKITYMAAEEGMLPFKINAKVRILSKGAGNNPELWGVEISGRRGYANKEFIMEDKVYIKDKDLGYEVPVVWPPKSSQPPPVPADPVIQTEKQQEQSLGDTQPVLNASETVDDVATTTTSPLDSLKLALLTEQEQAGSNESPTPITPVQPNIQLVDGTALPLEVISVVPEKAQNQSQEGDIKTAIENKAELEPETISDDEFDYEDDEEINDNDDDDEATLDSKDSGYQKDPAADSKTATATGLKPEAKEKQEILAPTTETPSVTEPQPEGSQKPNEAPLLIETRKVNVEPIEKIAKIEVGPEVAPSIKPDIQKDAGAKIQPMSGQVATEETASVAPNGTEDQAAKQLMDNKEPNTEKVEVTNIKPEEEKVQQQLAANSTEPSINEPVKVKVDIEAPVADEVVTVKPAMVVVEVPPDAAVKPMDLDTSTVAPTADSIVPVSLPPLFNKQNFQDPNEYYKLLQEQQQQQQEKEQEQQKQEQKDELKDQQKEQDMKREKRDEKEELKDQQKNEVKKSEKLERKDELKDEQKEEELRQQQQEQDEKLRQQKLEEQQQQEREKLQQQQLEEQEQLRQQEEKEKLEQQQLEKQQQEKEKLEKEKEQQENLRMQQEKEKLEQQRLEEEQQQEALRQRQLAEQQEQKLRQEMEEERRQQQEQDRLNAQQRLEKQQQEHKRQERERQQEEQRLLEQQRQQGQQPIEHTTPTQFTHDAYDAVYQAEPTPAPIAFGSVEQIGRPAEPIKEETPAKPGLGLFSTIMNTVNSFISNEDQKEPKAAPLTSDDELHRLLYSNAPVPQEPKGDVHAEGYCSRPLDGNCHAAITLDNFLEVLAAKVLEHSLLLLCVVIAAASSLFFIFTYYCFCNSSQEGALLSKLNHLERSLLASHKENLIIKNDLMATRTKLSSIEDNSFGSNDMVAALKKELESELLEKAKLQEQISSLEKDLDNAAEAGLELNKMLSEVLNSQNGDEAFMSTVEELQRQLNDQEKIIIDINASLAEKSRENSELQYSYTESTTRLTSEMKSLQQDNYELEMEKSKLQTRLEEIQAESEQELAKALEARNFEMQKLQHQIMELSAKYDKEHSELQTSLAKIEALEDCLKTIKKDGNANVQELITSAKTRGELNAAQKKFNSLQTKLEQELANKARLESQLQASSADVEQLKQDFNQSERDKLEAQTRLEVLSGYFREKETQLQKELSLQEAKWLQHQGENASTVETQTLMKNEIQMLKSQNDELRAEIEAQIASHKAQMGTLENRAHESWLAARQSERRCEEALAEAAGLRRKLTAMASGSGEAALETLPANGGLGAPELTNAPSPLPLPGSPGLLNMPNPLPFLPAPFSPFMGLPPPFLPPAGAAGGARPPPLGRMRSPPPNASSRDRYSPHRDDRDDYSDYDDYDDDDDDDRGMDRHRRHSGSWGRSHHRDSYMHSPRTYRSLSPSDSRYNYNDTETDFSPPPSPSPPRKSSSRPLSEV